MMMRNLLIAFFAITSLSLSAQDLGLQFVSSLKGTTSPDLVEINHAQVKSNGTIFTGGYFRGTIDFDPDPVNTLFRTSNEVYDIFIAKYTSEGELLNSSSVLTAGGAGDQYITDMALSGSSLVVLGNIEGSADFTNAVAGTTTVNSNGNLDILLAKFDEGGLANTWAYNIGGSNVDFSGGLAVDFSGNIYISGSFIGSVDFDPSGNGTASSMLTAPGAQSDIFIAKYNPDGELIWAHNFGGSGGDGGFSIKVDGSHVYVTGVFNGNVDFDPGPGTATIASNQFTRSAFIAKYDLNGNYVWAKSVIGGESSSEIAVNDLGDIAITGYYQVNNADFDPGVGETLLPYESSLPDAYVVVLNNDGELKWAKSIGGPNSSLEIPEVVSFGEDGSVFVTGSGGGKIDFNQQGNTSYILTSQSTDAFIANYDADGTLNYAYLLGGSGSDYGAKHTIDGGNLIVYGRQRSAAIDFDFSDGASIATSVNLDDTYLAKYDYTPPQIKTNNTGIPTLGSDLLVSVELEDKESGVATGGASIRYRGLSESANATFKQVTLTKKTGNVFEGTIPSDDFDGVGIEFFGVATNTVGVVGPVSTLITSHFNVPDGLTIPQKGTGDGSQEDYRIISIPLTLNNKTVKSIFEDDLGPYNANEYRLFSYGDQTTELNANSSLEVGKGYWLIVAGNDRPMNTGGGTTVAVTRTEPYRLELNPGWNLIGNPYNFNISWTEMKAFNGNLTEDLRVFNGSFSNGTKLEAFGGGFIFADDTKTIEFPVVKNKTINGGRVKEEVQPLRKPLNQGDWEVVFNLDQTDASYHLGGLGMRGDAQVAYDVYDEITLPRFGNYLEINHEKSLHGFNYSMDVVPTSIEKTWEFTIESAQEGATTISWDPSTLSSLENQLILVDLDNQWPVDMAANSAYTFQSSGKRHFKAVYGDASYVKKEIAGGQFVFYGVHPNPAAYQASITYAIPEQLTTSSAVNVSLFSSLGQKVASFAYNVANSGIKEEVMPLHQLSLTPGIYIVQIQFGNIQKSTRLLIK
jgi:hypothetical protein